MAVTLSALTKQITLFLSICTALVAWWVGEDKGRYWFSSLSLVISLQAQFLVSTLAMVWPRSPYGEDLVSRFVHGEVIELIRGRSYQEAVMSLRVWPGR